MNNIKDKLISAIVTGLVGISLGFGTSQALLANTVTKVVVEQNHQRESILDIKASQKEMRETNNSHMAEVIGLFKETFKQNQEFINLLKVQNELLSQKR